MKEDKIQVLEIHVASVLRSFQTPLQATKTVLVKQTKAKRPTLLSFALRNCTLFSSCWSARTTLSEGEVLHTNIFRIVCRFSE